MMAGTLGRVYHHFEDRLFSMGFMRRRFFLRRTSRPACWGLQHEYECAGGDNQYAAYGFGRRLFSENEKSENHGQDDAAFINGGAARGGQGPRAGGAAGRVQPQETQSDVSANC